MSREQQVRDAIDRFVAQVRGDVDTRLEALSAELLQVARGDARSSRTDIERAAIEVARAVAKGGTHAKHDLISRVIVAIRRLDDAVTLRGILDALADGASAESSRVAVLLVDGDVFRAYRHAGFSPGALPVDVPVAGSSLLSSAMSLRQTTPVRASSTTLDASPAFMRVPAGHLGLIAPVVVAKAVVALVYVEGPDVQAPETGAPVWSEQVEVLVRHASARLENVTSQRTVEVLSHSS
jgi:hypothetical protein